MSNDPQTPESDNALDLSGLNFGPAWARDDSEKKPSKKYKDRGDRDDSRDQRRGGGGRHDRRGGGGRPDRRGGGGRGKFQGGRGPQGDRERHPEVEAPEGFKTSFMPSEESLDLLAKEVMQTGRTFSVFDLAKVLLQGRDRFRVTFENPNQKFFRCREDNSIWLTKSEALRQLWRGDWRSKYYTEVQTEGEAPSGSFQAVAKCGLSGKYLGPPNYHAYQQNVLALHREQFANMSLERYKAKIVMERSEEAVEAWLESMKTVTQWKVAAGELEEEAKTEEPQAEEAKSEEPQEEVAVEEAPAEESPTEEEITTEESSPPAAEESTETPADEPAVAEEEPAPVAEEAVVEEGELFKTSRDVEQHFLENHFDAAFEETNRAWVMGDIQGKLLSPGLLTLLKSSVAEEKRYPANLMPIVCRQLSGRHVAVFKWQKKLKVGPSRPHAVSKETILAERPQKIIDFLKEKSGEKLEGLWKTVLPEDASDELKSEWYHDLHWVLNQGHAILLSDTSLHLAKAGGQPQQPPAKKAAKKKASEEESEPAEGKKASEDQESPKEKEEAPVVADSEKAAEEPAAEPAEPVAEDAPPAAEEDPKPEEEKPSEPTAE